MLHIEKYRAEVGRLMIASCVFILPPILELHNKNCCSPYLICQFISPTIYSCRSSLIDAAVFQVTCSCVQCSQAKLCEAEVIPAILCQFCQPMITANISGLADPVCFPDLKVTIHTPHFGTAIYRNRHRDYLQEVHVMEVAVCESGMPGAILCPQ